MKIIFLNTYHKTCGVYQYGYRLSQCLESMVEYKEVNNYDDYARIIRETSPDVVIFNYHAIPMDWLTNTNIIRTINDKLIKNYGITHESDGSIFDCVLDIDPTKGIPRPLFYNIPTEISSTSEFSNFINYNKGPDVPIFGSFGFGFLNKGFDRMIQLINNQYDNAIIKLVIPLGHYVPKSELENTINHCFSVPRKPGVELLISNDFFENDELLLFLQSNTMNMFMYDRMQGRGISSTIDYALSVNVPIAISNSYMFRHIYNDSICANINSLEQIRNQLPYFNQFKEKYSKDSILKWFTTNVSSNIMSYSQASQDLFVLHMTKFKTGGFFLEIGSNDPIQTNNSYLLESRYGWNGIMVEYDTSFKESYTKVRPKSVHAFEDARKVNYANLTSGYKSMDYLQIDLDVNNRSTLDTLELLDRTVFDKTQFATVTFEHDIYTGNYFDTQKISREIFAKRGYQLVFPDVSVFFNGANRVFEDWYVHPDLVDMEYVRKVQSQKSLTHTEIIEILCK